MYITINATILIEQFIFSIYIKHNPKNGIMVNTRFGILFAAIAAVMVIKFSKSFLVLFLSTLGIIASIGITIDNSNNAFGQSVIDGTPGNDYQQGTPYPDTITGYGGNDRQYGYGGNDYLYGDQQSVYGGSTTGGNDAQYGGTGNDSLYGDIGSVYSSNYASSDSTVTTTVTAGNDIQNGGDVGDNEFDSLYGDVEYIETSNIYSPDSTATTTVTAGNDIQTAAESYSYFPCW